MADLIDRQAAIDVAKEELDNGTFYDIPSKIEYLPSAQPEPRWIPCSERLPEDDTLMLVHYIDPREGVMSVWIGWHEMENVWYIDGNAHCKEFGNEVVAWLPIPEYKEGADE